MRTINNEVAGVAAMMERERVYKSVKLGGLDFHCMHRTTGSDGGATIEVYGEVDGKPLQVLRFDCFQKGPHFHYAPGDRSKNIQFHFEEKMVSKALDWSMEQIRLNIPEMLLIAGYKDLAATVDRQALATGYKQVLDTLMSTKPAAV